MSSKINVFGSVGLIVVFALSVFGQTSVLQGHVVDQQGEAVSGAFVTVRNKANEKSYTSQSDAAGKFSFLDLPFGEYLIVIKNPGFSDSSTLVSLSGTSQSDIKIVLKLGNINEEVTVTATRTQVATSETAVPVTVVGRQELEQQNVNTVGDAFRNLPGVSTVNEGSFQVRPRIRGLDSNRILVLVDGERLNNARTSTSQSGIELGLVGTEQIESIEVVRGSGSVLYGTDALGGTINIITKDAPRNRTDSFKFGAVFNGFFGSSDSGRRGSLAFSGSNKFFSFRLAQSLERYGNYSSGDPGNLVVDGINENGEVLNSQSHGSNTQFTTRMFFDDDNDIRLSYNRRRAGNIGVPTLVGAFNAFFPRSDLDKFGARFETRNITSNLAKLSGSIYYQNQKRNFSNILTVPPFLPFFPGLNNFSETITNTDSFGFDIQTNWIAGKGNFLTVGTSYFRDKNRDQRLEESRIPVTIQDRTQSVPEATFGSFAGFFQDEYDIGNRAKLIGGIRIERFFSNSLPTDGFGLPASLTPSQIDDLGLNGLDSGLSVGETTITGDFGAVFHLTDAISASARIGRSFRVPNLFERFFTGAGSIGGFVVANPNLNPESGTNIDTSLRVRTNKFSGSFTYFNNTYRDFLSNEIARDRNGVAITLPGGRTPLDVFQTVNIGRARIQGFEIDSEYSIKLGLGFLTPSGNISYLRGDDLEADLPLDTITPLKTVLNLRWTNFLSSYYVDWTTRIVNKQERLSPAFLTANAGAEPGFAVSEIAGGYVYKSEHYRMNFNVGVKNIFDRFYNEQFVFAAARGRSFVFGTTLELK